MEIIPDTEHHCLVLGNTFDFVAPFSCDLDGRFHSFSACIHWQDHFIPKHLCDELGKFGKDVIIKCSRAQGQSLRLFCQCLYELWVAVPLAHGTVGGKEVKVVFSFL